MNSFSTVNPATGETLKTYKHLSWDEAQQVIAAAKTDFQKWRRFSMAERSKVLVAVASALRSHKKAVSYTHLTLPTKA